ncbi:hypothetical protein BH10PSE7_BH10PSE7_36100 [soil metagenome]
MTKPGMRCAIYTRVSSDQGLEQEFNSLDAQREACSAYIRSQASEGWKALSKTYDDGGFSGGSLERPAVQQLLEDIRSKKVDIVVVYKVDRLTRSLADFAKLVELFDGHAVSFVSVTQSFNTTTSMGRLTLNVLLSFAQFEREVTGERIRDKIAASKKKGMWVGGVVPLGYRVENKRLVVEEDEAALVQLIYQRYFELGSLRALQRDLLDRGVRSRRRIHATGRIVGDIPFTNGPLAHLLCNRIYLGEITHQGQSYAGDHSAIIDAPLFDAVQAKFEENLQHRRRDHRASGALLSGRIYDDRGNRMSPTYAMRKNLRYRYYVSAPLVQGQRDRAGGVARVPAAEIESAVLAAIKHRCINITDVSADDRALVDNHLDRVTIQSGALELILNSESRECEACPPPQTISIPWSPSPSRRKRELLMPADKEAGEPQRMKIEHRMRMLRALHSGLIWLDELRNNKLPDAETLAVREGCSERKIRQTVSLAFLAPDIISTAVEGRLPRGLGLTRLTELPMDWAEQRRVLGIA